MLVATLIALALPGSVKQLPRLVGQNANLANQTQFKFTENKGQWDPKAKFLAHSPDVDMWVTSTGIAYSWHEALPALDIPLVGKIGDLTKNDTVFVDFVGATGQGKAEGIHALPGIQRYVMGAKKNFLVHSYSSATIKDLYQGIDLVTYFDEQEKRPRYDLIVHPGADAAQIKMRYRGAKDLQTKDGQLQYTVADGIKVQEQREIAYQKNDGGPDYRFVPRQVLNQDKIVSFDVTGYKRDRTLVIDPLVWSTYLGGSVSDTVNGMDVDSTGNVYATGTTTSLNFPTSPGSNPITTIPGAFAAKFDPNGNLVYSIILSGNGQTQGTAVRADAAGNLYFGGLTLSSNLPTTDSSASLGGANSGFVGKINPDASIGYLYIVSQDGVTPAGQPVLSVTPAGVATVAAIDSNSVFAIQYGASGNSLGVSGVFSTRDPQSLAGVGTDSTGAIFVSGRVKVASLPGYTTGYISTNPNNGYDTLYTISFISKTTPGNSVPDQETLLGGIGQCIPLGVRIDSHGNPIIAGYIGASPQSLGGVPVANTFPTTAGAFDSGPIHGSNVQGFVAKLSNDLTQNLATTLFQGGTGVVMWSLVLDSSDSPIVTGEQEGGIPLTYDYYSGRASPSFVAKLSSDLSTVTYGTYFADNQTTTLPGGVDSSGRIYLCGFTQSATFPTTAGAFQTTYPGGTESGFLTLLDPKITDVGLVSVHTDRGTAPALAGGSGKALTVTLNLIEPPGTQVTMLPDVSGVVHINGQDDFYTATVTDASHVLVYKVTVNDVASDTLIHLTMSLGGQSLTVPLTIKPFLKHVAVRSLQVTGGDATTLYVYPYEVPQTDQVVQIAASPSSGVVSPTSVTIKGIASGASVSGPTIASVQTSVVATDTPVSVTASHVGGSSAATSFILLGPDVASVVCNPGTVNAGQPANVTVNLKAPYPTDLTFNLTSSNLAYAPNVSVLIPAGQLSASGSVTTNTFTGKGNVTVRFGGILSSPAVSGGLEIVPGH